MQSNNNNNNNEPYDISSDDEDENEARLSCSLRWLISKAYPPHSTVPDYLPNEHFFQNDNNERFLSPDIALVLLSGDLYIRAFQYITNQQNQLITYDDLINYFYLQNIIIDIDLLKQDDPLNAHVHLELIENLMKIYFQLILDQNLLYQRFENLQLKNVLTLLNKATQLNTESLLIIWINGICEYMANQWSQRIPPVIDLRSSLIDGTCLHALVSYYDKEYHTKNDLNSLRNYLNHHHGSKMTNIFPFTVKNLCDNLIPDINLHAMLVDLFVLYEIEEHFDKKDFFMNFNENEDEENMCTTRSNQTYSINGDDNEDDINEFFILNNNNNNNEQIITGGILQTSTNHDRQMVNPIKSSLKTSVSASTAIHTSPKKTTFMPTTTTWQRQALSNQTTPMNTTRTLHQTTPVDDHKLSNELLAVKMQLEMKKRSIEREKQRLETIRDNERQTISQKAFKQLLQQKTRNTSALTHEFLSSPQSNNTNNNNQIRKSQTTSEFRSQTNTPPLQQPVILESKKEETSIIDLSKPMTRDDFLNTLEILKQKYLETTPPTTTTTAEDTRNDEGHRIEQLNSNIGELQQVLSSLSVKQEEIHNQVVNSSGGGNVSRNPTFTTKSLTFPRRLSSVISHEEQEETQNIDKSNKTNGLVLDIVEDPSASTAVEMERKRELVLQKQLQRQEAFERRRQMREEENLRRDDEKRRKDYEESAKKIEREQRRDEIYKQYLMKKDGQSPNSNDHTNGEHPIIKMRPKSSTIQRPPVERRQTGPVVISTFGTPVENPSARDMFNNSDLNETISTPLSFIQIPDLRSNKSLTQRVKVDSRTLPRSSARSTTEPPLPLIPVSEPRYPLAKPLSGKSNKQTIINSLTQAILAGRVNDQVREQVKEEIERNADKVKHFVILFRDSRLQFRGVYTYTPTPTSDAPTRIERLYGQGPREITETMVENFYKYNNGSKKFSPVPIKSFSVQCDAITILNQYWNSQSTTLKRASTATTTISSPPSN
ncbi:unnamed protein product [Adineta steineri]|uniref:CKK domain-containing protein n=1 Tax=Adineta steineri TaxID=433720 RepID=A0A814DM40_9BILA|nr:unnamed protein product [Adineta steineri]CAF1323444.1 unnamed protein product [Adineta steineri]